MGMVKSIKHFGDLKVGQSFSFVFGHRGERAGWVKVGPRRYQDIKTGQSFTIGTVTVRVK